MNAFSIKALATLTANRRNTLLPALFGFTLLLGSCASVDSEPEVVESMEVVEAPGDDTLATEIEQAHAGLVPEVVEEEIEYGNFSEDILNRVIIAEMAGQRGLNQEALEAYLSLARETNDLGIIKRASRIAAFSRNAENSIEMANMWLEHEPDSIEAHQTLAFQMVNLGRYGRALDHMSQLLELDAQVDFRLITSKIASDANNAALIIDALIADFEDLSQRYPQQSVRLALINLYQQNNQLQEAYETASLLSEETNDAPEIVILEIRLLELLGESENASLRLQQSLDTNPEHKQLRFLYGRKLVDDGLYTEAMEQFSIIVEQFPDDFNMLYSLALISMEVNRFTDARKYLQHLVDNSERLDDSHYYLAFISTQENDIDQAIEHYLLVEAGANYLPAQRNVTELMVQQGHYAEASARLKNVRFRNPDYNIQLLSMEANVLLSQNLQDEASTFLNSAVGAFPNNIQLLFLRSVLSAELNDLELMEQDLRKVIRLNPNDATAYNSLGYTLADRTDRIEEAYELIQKAITLAPNDPAIIDSLGWVQYRLGLYEEAKVSLDKAFELFPDHEVAAHLGEVLWVLGEQRAANRVWQNALKVQPESEFILEAMSRLKAEPSI